MLKTEKVLRLRSHQGRPLQVVREHYIRDDVPCYSQRCLADCKQNQVDSLPCLPDDVTHYLVPDCQLAREYLEILETSRITGIIFTQTVTHSVQHEGSRRLLRRLQTLVRDPNKRSVLFHNEHQKYAYHARQPGQSLADWQNKNVYEAAAWYYNHLAAQIPIILVTTDPHVVKQYGESMAGVYVMQLKQYLHQFWPDLTDIHTLYESIHSSATVAAPKGPTEFSSYLSSDVVERDVRDGRLLRGVLNVSRYHAQTEATIRSSGVSSRDTDSEQDVFIWGSATRNRAVHGDSVVVELLPRSQWRGRSLTIKESEQGKEKEVGDDETEGNVQPTGRVVGILQRGWRDYVVSLSQDEEAQGVQRKSGRVLVIPMDWRIPKICVATRQVDSLRDQRFVVRIDSWEQDSVYPNGHYVRTLGHASDLETEIAGLLLEHQITVTPFSDGLLKEMLVSTPAAPWCMDPAEVSRRRDLRQSHLVFSIDPKGCEDVDDTLSVRQLPGGGVELGVHIADVTHFLRPGSLADQEARARSTTVYLADRRYDMLPGILSADLCSLISGVDRYAVSVLWQLDPGGVVSDVWYGRSVIRSAYKLYYELAQEIHDGASEEHVIANVPELADLSPQEQAQRVEVLQQSVTQLIDISRMLKANRTHQGALQLEGSEVKVEMADSKEITDLVPKQSLEIHETIAECMIFANHWVAKKICETYPSQSLLRRHPVPRQDQFAGLLQCAAVRGFTVNTDSNKALAESLDSCTDDSDPTVNKVLRSLATRAMSNAMYFSTGAVERSHFFHYGLALDLYTHFTSPIRRYADVVVHRLLLASLGDETAGEAMAGDAELQTLAEHMNSRHRAAQYVQTASVELFQSLFFRDKAEDDECRVVDAVILQTRANGLMVHVPRYGLRNAVYLRSRDQLVAYVSPSLGRAEWVAGTLTHTPTTVTVTTLLGQQTYTLLDHITVRVGVQSRHAHLASLSLELVTNSPHAATSDTTPTTPHHQKAAIIKEVTAGSGLTADTDAVHLGAKFPQWQREYGQTTPQRSLYCILQAMADAAIMDL